MKYNKNWFSLVFALWLTLLVTLLAMTILEYIIPFSKNVKGIEHSTSSYYNAHTGLEKALLYMKDNPIIWTENTHSSGTTLESFTYNIVASGSVLPPVWEGNSEYDSHWNKIAIGQPVQLSFDGNNISWSSVNIYFRVPNIDINSVTLSGSLDGIVNWQLSSLTDTLNSSGSFVLGSHVCESWDNCNGLWDRFPLNAKLGVTLSGGLYNYDNFFDNYCEWIGKKCNLKFSVVHKLETTNWISIPYLEWKIDFGGVKVPLRYTRISSSGSSLDFQKELDIRVPQQTVSEIFDFTVFQ